MESFQKKRKWIKVKQGNKIVRKFEYPTETKLAIEFAQSLAFQACGGRNDIFRNDISLICPIDKIDWVGVVGSKGTC